MACIYKAFFGLSMAMTSLVLADYVDNGDMQYQSQCCPEEYTCFTPSARPEICNGADFYVTGEFIWWTAREAGLAIAADGFSNGITGFSHSGKLHYVDFKWRPGFKVGIGLNLDHDCWDIYANYTWFQGKGGKRSVSSTPTETTIRTSLLTNATGLVNPIQVEGSWNLHFNVVDLELARNFYVSRCLALRPFVGVKGTWQTQRFHAQIVSQFPFDPTLILPIDTAREQFKERFGGIGLRGGLDSNWYFTRHWGIYANASASALWGRFNNRTKENVHREFEDHIEIFDLENVKDKFDTLLPVLEMGLGLKWENWFSCDEYHIEADLGWEEQIWFAMNDFSPYSLAGSACSNLVLYGLTAKLQFDF